MIVPHSLLILRSQHSLAALCISWFYSLGWACFITLIPPGETAAYNAIFSFLNAIFQIFPLLVYTAIVQATGSHRLAWALTTVPIPAIGLCIMMRVNFHKGKIDAGHGEAKTITATPTPAQA